MKPAVLPHNYYSTVKINPLGANEVKEITIPIDYGNIAAKAWGNNTEHPVLALHGWLDNCGTFDTLFPLLSDKLYIVAMDAPGHGMSSHRPPGDYYTDISMIMDFKKVTEYLNWQKFSIIAHSLGGSLALMFAAIFPENIHKLVILDDVKPSSRAIQCFPGDTIQAVKTHMEIEKKMSKAVPTYTLELAAEKLRESLFNEVSLESAKILIKRSTKPSKCGTGVVFSRDTRCKSILELNRRTHEFIRQFMSAVKSEILMIKSKNTHPIYLSSFPEAIDLLYDIHRKNAKKFIFLHVDDNHFVHLNNPEKIAPAINDFFSDI